MKTTTTPIEAAIAELQRARAAEQDADRRLERRPTEGNLRRLYSAIRARQRAETRVRALTSPSLIA